MAESPRQFRAAVATVENTLEGGNLTKRQIMEQAGYSKLVALHQPHQVTQKPSFQALLDKLMPDEFIIGRHNELMEQEKNLPVARDMVELAYRVKGHLKDSNMPAGAALLGMMLGQQQLEQPTIYADVEAQSVNNEPTDDKRPEAPSDIGST